MAIMQWAFDVVQLAITGITLIFTRLFNAFDMGSFLYPILLISVIYWFLLAPFVNRVHSGVSDDLYSRSSIGKDFEERKLVNAYNTRLRRRVNAYFSVKGKKGE